MLLFLIYHLILRQMMDYYMVQFLHFTPAVPKTVMAGIMLLTLLIVVVAVIIPAGENCKEKYHQRD